MAIFQWGEGAPSSFAASTLRSRTSLMNENTLFFPAAGAKTGFTGPGSNMSIWSKTLTTTSRYAHVFLSDFMTFNEGTAFRIHGHSVRPVYEDPDKE